MEWEVLYEYGRDSSHVVSIVFGVAFGTIALLVALYQLFHIRREPEEAYKPVLAVVIGCFGMLISFGAVQSSILSHNRTTEIYESGDYEVVDGIVEDFDPMPWEGHKHESFTMNGIYFEYSDSDESHEGFNNTKTYGGPIDSGKHLRLTYHQQEGWNVILRIEQLKPLINGSRTELGLARNPAE